MYRQSWGLTHNGIWDWGQSKLAFNYEKTNNTRLAEGSTGKVEGMITLRIPFFLLKKHQPVKKVSKSSIIIITTPPMPYPVIPIPCWRKPMMAEK
jgi:outer membrane receptor for ferrienterochelin and colicin